MKYITMWWRRYRIFFGLLLFLIILMVGCGNGGKNENEPGSLPRISVSVELPDTVNKAELEIISVRESTKVDEEGNTEISCLSNAPFIAVAQINDILVAMALIDPDSEDNQMSCLETAITLVIIRAGLLVTPDNLKSDLIIEVKSVEAVQDLADLICSALASDISAVADPGEDLKTAFLAAEEAVIQHLENLL